MSSDRISLDLDDLDDDLSQAANDFDLGLGQALSSGGLDGLGEPKQMFTLESILNEDDDLENDEILKSLGESLTLMRGGGRKAEASETDASNSSFSQSRSSSFAGGGSGSGRLLREQQQQQQSVALTDKNGIVCKQAALKQISAQLVSAIERSDAGLPTTLAVGQLFAVGTSRGLILLFDAQQILKLYITTENKEAITALGLNNRWDLEEFHFIYESGKNFSFSS